MEQLKAILPQKLTISIFERIMAQNKNLVWVKRQVKGISVNKPMPVFGYLFGFCCYEPNFSECEPERSLEIRYKYGKENLEYSINVNYRVRFLENDLSEEFIIAIRRLFEKGSPVKTIEAIISDEFRLVSYGDLDEIKSEHSREEFHKRVASSFEDGTRIFENSFEQIVTERLKKLMLNAVKVECTIRKILSDKKKFGLTIDVQKLSNFYFSEPLKIQLAGITEIVDPLKASPRNHLASFLFGDVFERELINTLKTNSLDELTQLVKNIPSNHQLWCMFDSKANSIGRQLNDLNFAINLPIFPLSNYNVPIQQRTLCTMRDTPGVILPFFFQFEIKPDYSANSITYNKIEDIQNHINDKLEKVLKYYIQDNYNYEDLLEINFEPHGIETEIEKFVNEIGCHLKKETLSIIIDDRIIKLRDDATFFHDILNLEYRYNKIRSSLKFKIEIQLYIKLIENTVGFDKIRATLRLVDFDKAIFEIIQVELESIIGQVKPGRSIVEFEDILNSNKVIMKISETLDSELNLAIKEQGKFVIELQESDLHARKESIESSKTVWDLPFQILIDNDSRYQFHFNIHYICNVVDWKAFYQKCMKTMRDEMVLIENLLR